MASEAEPVMALLVLAMENCTEIYGNVTNAAKANVTCLDHAPMLTKQVRRPVEALNHLHFCESSLVRLHPAN
jgi:hypothetical protein